MTAESFARVSAWGSREWASYAAGIPGRDGEEEQAVWEATRPLIAGSGTLFSHDLHALEGLQDILRARGIMRVRHRSSLAVHGPFPGPGPGIGRGLSGRARTHPRGPACPAPFPRVAQGRVSPRCRGPRRGRLELHDRGLGRPGQPLGQAGGAGRGEARPLHRRVPRAFPRVHPLPLPGAVPQGPPVPRDSLGQAGRQDRGERPDPRGLHPRRGALLRRGGPGHRVRAALRGRRTSPKGRATSRCAPAPVRAASTGWSTARCAPSAAIRATRRRPDACPCQGRASHSRSAAGRGRMVA